jgi:hypothetical protein
MHVYLQPALHHGYENNNIVKTSQGMNILDKPSLIFYEKLKPIKNFGLIFDMLFALNFAALTVYYA